MLDLSWTEIALIVAVAVIVIGPKDLPDAVRGLARGLQKLRRMASEAQSHLDDVVREAKLEDVRDQIRDIRNFDLKGEVERAVDRDGSLRDTLRDDPFRAPPPPTSDAAPAPGTEARPLEAGEPPPPADATSAVPPAPEMPATIEPAPIGSAPGPSPTIPLASETPEPVPLSSVRPAEPRPPEPQPARAGPAA